MYELVVLKAYLRTKQGKVFYVDKYNRIWGEDDIGRVYFASATLCGESSM
jgi:hypothetical protein